MKRIILIGLLCVGLTTYAQSGGDRLCGPEFSKYGLQGKTFSDALEYAANVHSEYQEYLLSQLQNAKSSVADTLKFKTLIHKVSGDFFEKKGFVFNPTEFGISFTSIDVDKTNFTLDGYSEQAKEVLMTLEKAIKSYDPANEKAFYDQIASLKKEALNMASETEVFAVGVPVFIAESSAKYWKAKGQIWLDFYTADEKGADAGKGPSVLKLERSRTCDVKLRKLGGADVLGGVGGAQAGTALGPGGAFAGAVLGSSTGSLSNLFNQVMDCLFSWWPF